MTERGRREREGSHIACPRLSLSAILIATVLAGCGPQLANVTGTVTVDDQPLESGRIAFQAPGQPMAHGEIGPAGRYSMNTGDRQGIQPGAYAVTVASYEMGQTTGRGNPPSARLITPAKYSRFDTTDLTADVVAGDNEINFRLTNH